MEHIAALLLIVGCSDDLSYCRELPAPAPLYQTEAECDAELETSIRGFVGQYPQILGKCVSVDPALEYVDAELVWDITGSGNLVASIEPVTDVLIASREEQQTPATARP